MKPARLVWSLCLLFFALMALATILAVDRSYRELPRVALAAAREVPGGTWMVPPSALCRDGEGSCYVLLVQEEEGPWGREYYCRRVPVALLRDTPEGEQVLVAAGQRLTALPMATGWEWPLSGGERVRFYPDRGAAP